MSDTPKPINDTIPAVATLVMSLAAVVIMTITFSQSFAGINIRVADTGAMAIYPVMSEVSGGSVCRSTDGGSNIATCTAINHYGPTGGLRAGQSATSTLTIQNTGTAAAASFTVAGGACAPATPADSAETAMLCSKMKVLITSGATTIYSGTAADFALAKTVNVLGALGLSKIAPGSPPIPFTVTVSLDAGAPMGSITQPMTWSFGS